MNATSSAKNNTVNHMQCYLPSNDHNSNSNLLNYLENCHLRCYMTNVRSISNRLGEFQFFLDAYVSDVVVLTETWQTNDIPNPLFAKCELYDVFSHDRTPRGGGVCVLIKKQPGISIKFVELADAAQDLEMVAFDIIQSDTALPLRLIAVYRPPSCSSSVNDLLFSTLN